VNINVLRVTTTVSINNIPSNATVPGTFTPVYAYIGDGTTSVTSNTSSTCTVSSNTVSYIGGGTCTLVAHATAGTNYLAANGSPQSFTIAGSSVETQRLALIALVQSMNFSKGRENSLIAKLNVPPPLTCDRIQAFINEIKAQTNKDIKPGQAGPLIDAAKSLGLSLGCTLKL
jgi:hypothetical protein